MSDDAITRDVEGSRGRYVLDRGGHLASLTYSILSSQTVIADHTDVPEALRGSGAGLALVERLVSDARAEGFRIVPLCPFVNAERRKHPEWADAFNV
ncbi:GNAT family N-acetyltransferase [Sulfitobacter sabulilitoris]|uniref:N-acetyltransferase n=1 Tax=Sulfitobacter sabulilitoris TaxID=2562655 RepID=A0A5S3PRM7_9RHOB|nr:GNAT family N-acetyltransferase [Sulfitobacter sabulilitoris]TMM55225.1 N-acetyltransferase [Sulfitobacter sabulilitoris]